MLNDLETWLQQHDVTIDLITVWTLVICFALWGLSKARIRWTLRDTDDEEMIGVTLKHQKGMEALVGVAMATLYGLTLIGFYFMVDVGFLPRLILRAGIVLFLIGATFFSLRLDYYVQMDRKKGGRGA